MKRIFFLFVVACVFSASPSQARLLSAGPNLNRVPVYESQGFAGKKFTVVGKISVTANQSSDLFSAMQSTARRYGGDAVLAYRVLDRGTLPNVYVGQSQAETTTSAVQKNTHTTVTSTTPTQNTNNVVVGTGGMTLPSAEGIVVKFSPTGVSSLSEATEIPVLN
jgi:hypothetical protein